MMIEPQHNKNKWVKKFLLIGLGVLVLGGIGIWYIFNLKFEDTKNQKAAYTVNAMDFIKEFQKSDSTANKKYTEQIITVNGRVFETEAADTTVNIKMQDTLTGAYIIFAFQNQYVKEAKQIKEGDSVSIKGSCSGGIYSRILQTESINFKRCTLIEKF